MLKVENVEVWGFEHAIRGMRNPMNSWNISDSGKCLAEAKNGDCASGYCIGIDDMELMRKLYKAGTEHRKYLRQIFVSVDIVAPLYWWKEFDTYKIGVTANSCSTMHKIAAKEFTIDDFSHEHLTIYDHDGEICRDFKGTLEDTIDELNVARKLYLETKDKKWWWQMIQLLPSSYNQRRTVTMTYENVVTIIKQRSEHKLDEWRVDLVPRLRKLPYINAITEG